MAKKFSELRAKMSPESHERAIKTTKELYSEIPLVLIARGDEYIGEYAFICREEGALLKLVMLNYPGLCVFIENKNVNHIQLGDRDTILDNFFARVLKP